MKEYHYYVYILSSESGVLYTGVTGNLEHRVWQHKTQSKKGFTSRYKVNILVYYEETNDIGAAIEREKVIKGWVRRKKVALVNSVNPEWRDLSLDFMEDPTSCHSEGENRPNESNIPASVILNKANVSSNPNGKIEQVTKELDSSGITYLQNDNREIKMPNPATDLINLLRQKHLTIGTVESATGGLIAHLLTDVPGSSDVFKGSIIAYSNEVKTSIVGVKAASIEKFGAVSSQVAEEMAAGGRELLKVDICIADTGIAGPGGETPGKPVGLFYLGLADKKGVRSQKHVFAGTRAQNKMAAARAALEWVHESLR